MQRDEVVELWESAREKTGIDITPQKLRQWFCSEMLRRGVSETYVDAFCGRVPKSVLARHYTDFSPEKLKDVYGNARFRVFNRQFACTIHERTQKAKKKGTWL